MRIITGEYKGRILNSPEGLNTRPTSDKVKGAVFNIIQKRVFNSTILDLFAGTGSLGLEALSRGAKCSYFAEQNKDTFKILLDNICLLNLNDKCKAFNTDAYIVLKNLKKNNISFDIIFLDPPYFKGEVIKSIEHISQYNLLNKNGIIITEYDSKEIIPESIDNFKKYRTEKYGRTSISFWNNEGEN